MPVANSDKRERKKKEYLLLTQGTPRVPGETECPLQTLQSPASTCPPHGQGCRQERGTAGGQCDLSASPTISFSNYHQRATLSAFQHCCEDTMR